MKKSGLLHYSLCILLLVSFCKNTFAQSETTESYLFETCKVWGYVKYHSSGCTRPDEELLLLLNGKKSLDNFINDNIQTTTEKNNSSSTNSYCNISNKWIDECRSISGESRKRLQSIQNQSNTSILPVDDAAVKQLLKGKYFDKNRYTSAEAPDNNLKLLGVFRLWNHLNYFYPHRCQIKDFDSILINSIRLLKSNEKSNYADAIRYIAGTLKDPHAVSYYTIPQKKSLLYEYVKKVFPITIYITGEHTAFITGSFASLPLQPGDKILSINQSLFTKFTFNPTTLLSYDTLIQRNVINCTTLDSITIEISRANKKYSYHFDKSTFISFEQWFDKCFEVHEPVNLASPGVYYINATGITSRSQFTEARSNALTHDTIILDLRGYPQSDFSNKVVALFYPKKNMAVRAFIYPNYKEPGNFTRQSEYEKGDGIEPKKLYVLINNFTQSWSETLAISLITNPNTIFIGQNSANGLGQVDLALTLPGGIEFLTTDIGQDLLTKKLYPYGIIPDHKIPFINTTEEVKRIVYSTGK